MRSQDKGRIDGRDLVDELVGEESDDDFTHKPDGTYEILNDIVVDRGPNPSMDGYSNCKLLPPLTATQQCPQSKSSAMMNISPPFKQTAFAWQPQPDPQHTTSRQGAHSAIQKTR